MAELLVELGICGGWLGPTHAFVTQLWRAADTRKRARLTLNDTP